MALPVLRRSAAVDQENRRGRAGNPPEPAWSPWSELGELHERMGRLLSGAFADLDDATAGWRPAADVEETAEAYLVELELPGVKREDVSVEFGGGELSVTGEVAERERVGFLRTRRRPVGHFRYRLALPADVEADEVTASLADGVLTVRLPKSATARPRRIPVGS